MTDKDKKAFDEYTSYLIDYYYGNDDRKTHDVKVWYAACMYKQKQVEELKLEVEYLQDRVDFLDSLIEHGVDCWSGYSEAYKQYKRDKVSAE